MNKWDKKAQNYPRFSSNPDTLEAQICTKIRQFGIDFQDKEILDIGCGTGVYTLHIAQKAKHVDALDYSIEMLKALQEDAKKLQINNIHTYHCTWDEYQAKTNYDYAISTMSPATKAHNDFEKMTKFAKTNIFLGWDGKKGTEIMETLFQVHGGVYTPPNGARKLKEWLDIKNIPYDVIRHDEEKVRIKEFDKAVENYIWHLETRGLSTDRKKVIQILEKFRDADGNIIEKTINKLNLVIWNQ